MSNESLDRAFEAVDNVGKIAQSVREVPRHGVTDREAFFYDKGWDDALDGVRSFLRLSFANDRYESDENICLNCGVQRENCKPGGQWYDVCPLSPTGGDHEWQDKEQK